MIALLVTLVLQSLSPAPVHLRAELLSKNLPAPSDAADLDRPITSYSVLDDVRAFVIAYYVQGPEAGLQNLRVRLFDKRTRTWRSTTHGAIGSVLKIERHAGYLYLAGHSSPSAAPLLVLDSTLKLKHRLDGWPVLLLDDGRTVFHRSMVHFAPAHAGALAIYDPVADQEVALYPPASTRNQRGIEEVPGSDLLMNRSIADVKKGRLPNTIEFEATEQRVRVTPQNTGEAAGAEQRVRVSCNVAGSRPVCNARPALGSGS
jgi:hypothetical protein